MDHLGNDNDVLELAVDTEDLARMFGRSNNSSVLPDAHRVTRTIINDNYQKPNVEKLPRATELGGSCAMDTSVGGEGAKFTTSPAIQPVYADESLFAAKSVQSSSSNYNNNNNNNNVKEVDGIKHLRGDRSTKTERNATTSSDEPMDIQYSQRDDDTVEEDLEDPQIAEYKKELGEVERRIQEISGDDAIGDNNRSQGETSDSSSDSGSTGSTDEGKKSDSSRHEKVDSGSDSKKRKVSPMAVEEDRRSKHMPHSKHKKRKSGNGDRVVSARSKLVKDDKDMKVFFEDTRYFLIKSANSENVILSKAKGVWSTTPRNEQILNKAFRETPNVILVYSVEKSQAFQGFCRLASESNRQGSPVNWVLPPGMNARNLGGVFKVHWINRNEVPFTNTSQLFNPYNEYKPVKIGRDGTELAPNVGRELCGMFAIDEGVDLKGLIKRVRKMQAEVAVKSASSGRRRSSRYSEMRRQWGSPPESGAGGSGGGGGGGGGGGSFNRYTKPPPPDNRSSGWRDPPGSSSSQPPNAGYGGDGYGSSSSGRYKDVFINGSYYDYIREYSMAGASYGDPYANMYGAAQPVFNDPYYGYSGYTSQMMPAPSYSRRPPARSSPTREKYYSRDNSDYYRRNDQPPPRLAADHRRRHRSQSPDLSPPEMQMSTSSSSRNRFSPSRRAAVHSHRSKSPRRAMSPHHKRSSGGRR